VFERYTEPARRALFFARYEVSELGGEAIETEHLLLGVMREGKGFTSDILDGAKLQLAAVRADIEARMAGRMKRSTTVEIPFSQETKRILQSAGAEADRLRHDYVGTEHLLLGILCEPETAAGQILTAHGLERATLRDEVARLSKPPEKN
jgi:ATP-dependent Clp protease ATP-binding subunit ClpC